MKPRLIALWILLLPFHAAKAGERESVTWLIRQLSSSSAKLRESATRALLNRPEAESALRQAAKSEDAEVARRATLILDHFARRPIRDLKAAVDDGRADRVIDVVSAWPDGRYEDEIWPEIRRLACTLLDRHKKQGGTELGLLRDVASLTSRRLFTAAKVTATSRADFEQNYLLRAGVIDLDYSNRDSGARPSNEFMNASVGCCKGSVLADACPIDRSIIFAGGPVTIRTSLCNSLMIVSAGDVVLDCHLTGAIVIARGKVTCTGTMQECRIIAGKSVEQQMKIGRKSRNMVSENDLNPLGYIRWSDPPKGKAAAGGKK